ncbi:Kelch repeat-containing protein [Robertkochia aurantiaca]|uniref:Kelch repeat-containing protein n=1 Tax=Robertkochia aurantiaca TaxID=2873700 RepID=UPI001CC90155|nr:kelch repeat-containing protein [Robertkochia sp. 3YJGBD-33]
MTSSEPNNTSLSRRKFMTSVCYSSLLFGLHPLWSLSPKLVKWQPAPSMPFKLQEIYCAVLNQNIHVAGGLIADTRITGDSSHHLVYNSRENTWGMAAKLPESRHHLQLASFSGKLYGFGGFRMRAPDEVWVMQDQTWIYDPGADKWTTGTPAPVKHGETVAGVINDRIHIVGGRYPKAGGNSVYSDHTDTGHHLVYDPESDSWDQAAPAPTARNSAAGAVIGDLFYVVGGRTVSGGNVTDLEVYDPREDTWRKAAPIPQAQGGLAAASVNGKLYAFGGEYFDDGGGVYKQCWKYNPEADSWEPSVSMRSPRHGLAGTAIGNTIYAMGGALKAGGEQTSDLMETLSF